MRAAILWFLVWVFPAFSWAAGQVTDLTVTKVGKDVRLEWNTGAPPFRILRAPSKDFILPGCKILEEDYSGFSYVDEGMADSNMTYYVMGGDDEGPEGWRYNAKGPSPRLFSVKPNIAERDTLVVIEGKYFPEYLSRGNLSFGTDHDSTIISSTRNQIVAQVPPGAVSGDIVLCYGTEDCSNPLPFRVRVGPLFHQIKAIAFDSSTRSLWIADGGSSGHHATIYELGENLKLSAHPSAAPRVDSLLRNPGSRTDSQGNVYFVKNTAVYVTPPEGKTRLLTSGFVNPVAMDLFEEAGFLDLLLCDAGSGKVWEINAKTGDKGLVVAGFNHLVGAAYIEEGDAAYLDVAEADQILRFWQAGDSWVTDPPEK